MTTDIRVQQREIPQAERTRGGTVYRPHVDITEEGDELTIVADMPGATSDTIDLNFEEGLLTIQGKVAPRYHEQVNFLLGEYGIGDFYRTFRISEQVDANRIHAEYGNGVLRVHLPKAAAAKPRKIEVQTAS